MKHLLHLVRADARRFRVLLALWVLVVIVETVFRAVRPTFVDERQLSMMFNLLATMLFATRWLGMVLIVALVVQTHPLVGSDAFWMTRPISWRVLLASKMALLVTTLVAVPTVAELALMVACRVPIAEALPIALQLILFQCLWLFIFMALSSVTRNLARLAVVAGSVLIGLILLLNVMIAVMMRRMGDGPRMVDVVPRTEPSPAGFVVMLLLTIAAAFMLVTVQYRTRSVRRSVLTGAAGICVALAAVLLWPSPGRLVPVPDWANRDSAVQLTAETPRGEFRLSHDGSPLRPGDGWQIGVARLTVRGVEEGWLPTMTLKDASITFDGATVRTAGNGYSTQAVLMATDALNDGPHSPVERQVLGVSRLLESLPFPQAERGTPAIILADAEFRNRLGSQGTYRGSFQVDLDRLTLAATLPLQAGATFQSPQRRLIVDQVIAQNRAASIRLRHFISTSMFASGLRPRLSFYLRNRGKSEAVAGSSHGGFGGLSTGIGLMLIGIGGWSSPTEAGNGFSIISDVIRFPAAYGGYAGGPPPFEITPEWLSQAELVIVHTIPAGSVWRDVEIAGFEIAEAPPPRPPG